MLDLLSQDPARQEGGIDSQPVGHCEVDKKEKRQADSQSCRVISLLFLTI